MSANSNKASLSPSCSARYKWTLSNPNRWLHFDAYFVNAQWTEWKKWERIVQLLKSINSSHNPNPIPNLWLGFSKDPKVLRNKDLPPSPRPKAMIQSFVNHVNPSDTLVTSHYHLFITTIHYYKLFFDLQ